MCCPYQDSNREMRRQIMGWIEHSDVIFSGLCPSSASKCGKPVVLTLSHVQALRTAPCTVSTRSGSFLAWRGKLPIRSASLNIRNGQSPTTDDISDSYTIFWALESRISWGKIQRWHTAWLSSRKPSQYLTVDGYSNSSCQLHRAQQCT